jgi:catechol 2,3-dioxygenase-like lactoylglutathione lyase family enzyme
MTGFDLDHLGIAVADLDAAAAQYSRLGFQLTARGYHTRPPSAPGAERPLVGTGNNCAMLRRGYLELIGVTDPGYGGRLRVDIARYQGLHIIAFGTSDAATAAEALRAGGVAVDGPRILERPIEEEGQTRLARFEIVDFPEEALPEGHFFAIRHVTPDLLWKPALLAHPNGALALDALTVAVAKPDDFARRLGRLLSVTPRAEDGLVLELAAGRVRVVGADWLAARVPGVAPALPYIAGIGLRVADLGRTAALLAANGVAHRRESGSIMIDPGQACGAFLEFRTKAAASDLVSENQG